MKQKGLILFIILSIILTLPAVGLAAETEEDPAQIPDVAFKDVLRGMLNKGVFDDIYPSELEQFTGHMDFSDMGITDLRGLQYFTNVTSFDFSNNEVAKLPTKISQMENMESLNLSMNDMYQLPSEIADAPNLKSLNVSGNKLSALPVRIQEMANLESLDISANRFEVLPHRLVYLHLTDFNCNYNFLDFSEGTQSKKDLDTMAVSGNLQAYKQLIKLPAITYETDNGDFKVKWRTAYDVPFHDGTTAKVVGYTILLDSEFIKTVGPEETEYSFGWMDAGSYTLSVSPDYNVEEFGDFPIRSYTVQEGATFGQDGPYIEENPVPTAMTAPSGASSSTSDTAGEPAAQQPEPMSKEGLSLLTIILIGAVVLLAAGLATMLVIFLKKDKA